MSSNTKRLFISHASEDKADFVRPLAEELKRHYQVWYDEYELVVGGNFTYEATLVCAIFKSGFSRFERAAKVREVSFRPTFDLSNQALWIEISSRQERGTDEMAAYLLDLLLTELGRQSTRP